MAELAEPDATPHVEEGFACRQCGRGLDLDTRFCPVCGTMAMSDSPDPLLGQVVAGRYRIVQLLGRGGMGVVYKCEHTQMGKVMALKLLHGEIARDAEIQRRFRREAHAASRLSNANTVGIFDFGTDDGLMYLVMEYVQGEDLGRVLRNGGCISPVRAAQFALQACASLSEAHEKGIIHRDLKPENLLVSRGREGRETVKLLDFGLARLREGEERNEITSHGVLLGTPYYMAPETIEGGHGDHRVDIYALGAVLYRAVTGVPPFIGTSPIAVLTRALTERLVPPSERRPDLNIPPMIDAIVARCMCRKAADRYENADRVGEDLEAFLASEGALDPLSLTPVSQLRHHTSVMPKPDAANARLQVATRDDVDQFERRLRRGRILSTITILAVLAGLAGLGVWLFRRYRLAQSSPKDTEVEPNDQVSEATLIAPDTEVKGMLGKRRTRTQGDLDLFRLQDIGPRDQLIDLEVTPPENIDAVVEVYKSGSAQPVYVMDGQAVGMREVVRGYRLDGNTEYFVSVHEHAAVNRLPVENVSDTYLLHYVLRPLTSDVETEPDDAAESAGKLSANSTVHGHVSSQDDADWWCFETLTVPVRVRLSPPDEVNLSLGVFLHADQHETLNERAGAGLPETVTVVPPSTGRPPCVVVRNANPNTFNRNVIDKQYTLSVEVP